MLQHGSAVFLTLTEKGTLRDIEDRCKNDLRCIYMLQGEQPTHSSFGNFINEYILPHQSKIFSLITNYINLQTI